MLKAEIGTITVPGQLRPKKIHETPSQQKKPVVAHTRHLSYCGKHK
jgi:hypothetical protein